MNSVSIYGAKLREDELSVDRLAEILRTRFPEVWRRVYTKHVDAPGKYMGSKALAVALCSPVVEAQLYGSKNGFAINGAANTAILERYDFPTYYVSEPLIRALLHTHPPKGMTWTDIVWPFEGVIFMIPRGVLREPSGKEIFVLGAVLAKAGQDIRIPGTRLTATTLPVDRVDVFWSVRPYGCETQDCCIPATDRLEPDYEWIDLRTQENAANNGYANVDVAGLPDGRFSAYMAGLVANLILVMQARKELVEPGRRTGRRLKSGAMIHTPTMLGPKYVVQQRTAPHTPTGAHFTELKWRAGHLRRQWTGRGRTEQTIVLIDPYIAYGAHLVRAAE